MIQEPGTALSDSDDGSVPNITRKTEKGLPRYLDTEESDVFNLSEAEGLVSGLNAG